MSAISICAPRSTDSQCSRSLSDAWAARDNRRHRYTLLPMAVRQCCSVCGGSARFLLLQTVRISVQLWQRQRRRQRQWLDHIDSRWMRMDLDLDRIARSQQHCCRHNLSPSCPILELCCRSRVIRIRLLLLGWVHRSIVQ